MAYVSMKQMLETGVHFGHQTRRWNPKMRPYIFGARNGVHIIDLQQTVKLFRTAHDKIVETVANGGKVLFIGTKRQAQEAVAQEAERAGQPYVTFRWMGGTLTNFVTIQKSVDRLKKLEQMFADGTITRRGRSSAMPSNSALSSGTSIWARSQYIRTVVSSVLFSMNSFKGTAALSKNSSPPISSLVYGSHASV